MTNAGGGSSEKSDEASVKAKACPSCQTLVGLAAVTCPTCGHEWPKANEPKHEARADGEVAILSTAGPTWVNVSSWSWREHRKIDRPTSLLVE